MAKTSADYLARLAALKASYLDARWSEPAQSYLSENDLQITTINSALVLAHAVMAGQGVASAEDTRRTRILVSRFLSAPCFTASNSWTALMDGSSDYHGAIDQPIAESLYYAHKHRVALGLDQTTIDAIVVRLTSNAQIPPALGVYSQRKSDGTRVGGYPMTMAEVYDNQNLAKWGLNRMTYGYLLGAGNAASIQQAGKRFLSLIDTASPATYVDPNTGAPWEPALFADYGWNYLALVDWQSAEYGLMSQGAFLIYYPDIAEALALTAGEIARAKAWQRAMLGQWQRNGYPNWDTCWSDGRLHTLNYWVWSIRSLTGMARSSALNMDGAVDSARAKWMLDAAIDQFDRMDLWGSDPADGALKQRYLNIPINPGVYNPAYNQTKVEGNAKFAQELAVAVDLGVADAPSQDPGNVWGWGWAQKHVHVSTPAYDAASLPFAPDFAADPWGMDAVQLQHWGVSRIAKPTGEILTALGGYGREAFSFVVSRSGVTDIDTGNPASAQPTQTVWLDGVQQTRAAYDTQAIPSAFSLALRTLCARTGTNYRVEVDTSFLPGKIWGTHRAALTGSAGPAVAVMSIPARKDVTIEYVAATGARTIVWNGTTVTPAGSPARESCRYIHMRWPAWNAGLAIIPRSGTVGPGAKVTALSYSPNGYPRRQPDQDRSLLIYLADTTTESVGDVEIEHAYVLTDGTDAGAEAAYAAEFPTAPPVGGGHTLMLGTTPVTLMRGPTPVSIRRGP